MNATMLANFRGLPERLIDMTYDVMEERFLIFASNIAQEQYVAKLSARTVLPLPRHQP